MKWIWKSAALFMPRNHRLIHQLLCLTSDWQDATNQFKEKLPLLAHGDNNG